MPQPRTQNALAAVATVLGLVLSPVALAGDGSVKPADAKQTAPQKVAPSDKAVIKQKSTPAETAAIKQKPTAATTKAGDGSVKPATTKAGDGSVKPAEKAATK